MPSRNDLNGTGSCLAHIHAAELTKLVADARSELASIGDAVGETHMSLQQLVGLFETNVTRLMDSVLDTAKNQDMIPVSVLKSIVLFMLVFNFALIFGIEVASKVFNHKIGEVATQVEQLVDNAKASER